MKKNIFSWMALATAFIFTSCGNNNESTTTTTDTTTTMKEVDTGTTMNSNNMQTSSTPLEPKDKDFVKKAAAGGMMEVELGKIAQQNAANQRVKDFGAMMERDHSNANNQLMSMASNKNAQLNNDSLMMMHKSEIDKLKSKTGAAFDRAYMSMMVDDHKKDVNEFEKASNNVMDSDLKTWASNTLPTLKMHLDSAQAINKSIK